MCTLGLISRLRSCSLNIPTEVARVANGNMANSAKLNKWFTIYPSNTDGLKDGKSKKSHSTTCVIVKKLEDIQATLRMKQKIETKIADRNYRYCRCWFCFCSCFKPIIVLFSFVTLTSVTISRPKRKLAAHMKRRRNLRRCPIWKKVGYISEIAVTRASWYTNWYINRKSFRVSILWCNWLNRERLVCIAACIYLTIQSQEYDHDKEEDCP